MAKKYTPEELMALAIEEMKKSVPDNGRGDNKINPKVGAVLATPDGELLSTAHRGELRDGDHAEFTVLERKNRDNNLTGMVVYATLEPCAPGARNHPKLSCAERIFNARISKVYIGYIDPDPTVAGQGRDYLESKKIEIAYFPKPLQDIIYEENKKFIDQATIRANQPKKEKNTTPLKPLEKAIDKLQLDALSEEAQNDMISRMELPYKLGSKGFNKYLSDLNLIRFTGKPALLRPTGLGLLLLGRTPQTEFPQSRIKFTIERKNQEPFISEIEGPLLTMPKKVEDLLDAAFLTEINRENFHREELTKVSKTLLREMIINAIVHRDYEIEGAQIKVIASEDKIEIWSPGEPLFNMETFAKFEVPSQSVNPKIAYIFYKTKLVEERNIGMKELKKFKENSAVKPPTFKIIKPYFITTIYRSLNNNDAVNDAANNNKAINDAANSNDAVKQYINDAVNDAVSDAVSDAVTNRLIQEVLLIHEEGRSLNELMEYLGKGRATIQRDMALLKEQNLIEFEGAPKTGVYKLTNAFKEEIEKL